MLNFNLLGRTMIAAVFGAASLMACTSQKIVETPLTPSADPIRKVEPAPLVVGGARDAYGCLTPAGYSWCAKENSCVRSWELAAKKSLKDTPAAYEAYCSGSSK